MYYNNTLNYNALPYEPKLYFWQKPLFRVQLPSVVHASCRCIDEALSTCVEIVSINPPDMIGAGIEPQTSCFKGECSKPISGPTFQPIDQRQSTFLHEVLQWC